MIKRHGNRPDMNSIIYASTTELAAAIRAKNVSAVEVLDAHLDQIEKHNPTLNAVVTLDAEGARARAREADDARARGENWGPLHGVPFVMKDAFATRGMRSTIGFPPFDFVPQTDSTVAARLKAAGGILAGKTNVPTLLADYQANNPIFGRTNNPWDTSRTPGGSSGGAAAAVASGMTPFDVGTDLSGSVRIPAHFCGIYGLKPTEHRVPLTGAVPDPFESPQPVRVMSTIGPLARTVDDLALLYQIIAGPDGQDTDVPPMPLGESRETPLAGLRIAVAPTFPGVPVAQEISDAVTRLAGELAQLGATIGESPLPDVDFGHDLRQAGDLIAMMTGAFQSSDEPPTPLAQYLNALHLRDQSIAAWEEFFEEWDALLCPPAMIAAFPHCDPGSSLKVGNQETSYWMVSAHTTIFNYTGHPAIVMPYASDRNGLPIGVQLVGKRWDESRLLAMASAIAPTTGGFRQPPGF